MGLALNNNIIVLTYAFLFNRMVDQAIFTVALYLLLMALAALNVAPIRTPKFAGRWYYALILYTLIITGIFGWQLLHI
jgi:CDP-diacylglycerol--serine O-phosphatidyltransferase